MKIRHPLQAAAAALALMGTAALGAPATNQELGGYQLEQVVALSRHNIRAPMSTGDSVLARVTPHQWFRWTSRASELSLRGGVLETMMGQYFRRYLDHEGLIAEDSQPREGEVRIYANSLQRTIATAQYFSGGMFQVAGPVVEHHYEVGKGDATFLPLLSRVDDHFREAAAREITAMGGQLGVKGIMKSIERPLRLLERILDLRHSRMAREDGLKSFRLDDTTFAFNEGKEPSLSGSLKIANAAVDALILQHYEEQDLRKAGFGRQLTAGELSEIAKIKEAYNDSLFGAYSVAVNVVHPMLGLLGEELGKEGRKLSFLCGHDSTIAAVLVALRAEPYELPNSIEKKTPIGGKLVMELRRGADGRQYVDLYLAYQSYRQLRERTQLDLDTPPQRFRIKLRGIKRNPDGLYPYEDFRQRLREAFEAYGDGENPGTAGKAA
ncbi:MAG: histidine-type phosphatase [Succinivibrionaceae bacterium]|nr:histidine-type phosphatase [Succinivibrionaceae bacterium]